MSNYLTGFDLFMDRFEFIKLFLSYLNDSETKKKIIFFYGDGGNGKSFLIRYLKEKYCVKLPNNIWNQIKDKDPKEFVEEIDNILDDKKVDFFTKNVCQILIDLNLPMVVDYKPQESLSALLMIRRMIKIKGFSFCNFELAYIQYLLLTNDDGKTIKNILPNIDLDIICIILDVFTLFPFASITNSILKFIKKPVDKNLTRYLKERKVDKEIVEEIKNFKSDYNIPELVHNLPKYLALDINNFFKSDENENQLFLFFDTHESLWGDNLDISEYLYHQKDEWLRVFLDQLNISNKVTVVIAGRNKPKWESATPKISSEKLNLVHLDLLEEKFAIDYLSKSGIKDEYRDLILSNVLSENNFAHPILLALFKDLILFKQQNNQIIRKEDFNLNLEQNEKLRYVFQKLLKYVNRDTNFCLQALSASRGFDKEIFQHLGSKCEFLCTKASFDRIIEFSFIGKDDRPGSQYFKVHDIIRKISKDSKNLEKFEVYNKAHVVLEEYFRDKIVSNKFAIIDAIYHRSFRDKDGAVKEWILKFKKSMGNSDNNLCEALLKIVKYLDIDDFLTNGEIYSLNAQYFVDFCQYKEAIKLYNMAIETIDKAPIDFLSLSNKGDVLSLLGYCYSWLSELDLTKDACVSALYYLNKSISKKNNFADSYAHKGFALQMIGDTYYTEAKFSNAIRYYKLSTTACRKSIKLLIKNPDAVLNLAYSYIGLGDTYLNLHQLDKSKFYHLKAIQTNNIVINNDIDDSEGLKKTALTNIGYSWISIGEAYFHLANYNKAKSSFRKFLSISSECLKEAPNNLYFIDNKLYANCKLAEVHTLLGEYTDALNCLNENISSEETNSKIALNDSTYFLDMGLTYQKLGEIEYRNQNYPEALEYLNRSNDLLNNALLIDPNEDVAKMRKCTTYAIIFCTYYEMQNLKEAQTNYTNSIMLINGLIRKSTLNHEYLTLKGSVILKYVDKILKFENNPNGSKYLQQALKTLTRSININSNYIPSIINLGICHLYYGKLNFLYGKFDKAFINFNQAKDYCENVQNITNNNNVDAIEYKTLAYFYLGEIISKKESIEKAKEYYNSALNLIEETRKAFPSFKGFDCLQNLKIYNLNN